MEPIAYRTPSVAQASTPDLQKIVIRSAVPIGTGDPNAITEGSLDGTVAADSITLGTGMLPSLAVVTKYIQQEMENEERQAEQRAAENAQLEQEAEQQAADRAAIDKSIQDKATTQKSPSTLRPIGVQPPTPDGVPSSPKQTEELPGKAAGDGTAPVKAPPPAPIMGTGGTSAATGSELLGNVLNGLKGLDSKQLSGIHQLSINVQA